jgi:hypothetical protein
MEGLRANSRDTRTKLEARYADLIPHYQRWASGYPDLDDREACKLYYESARVVTQTLETDFRTHRVVYRLAIPLLDRLNMLRALDEKNPASPTNRKQTIRAIAGVDEEIRGLCIDIEFQLLQQVCEERDGPVTVNEDRWARLDARRAYLLSLLLESDRERFENS